MSTTHAPTTDVVAICRRFVDRADIEAAGYVPGWHGEPVEAGDLAVVYGQGQWRQAIVTKVTPKTVHVSFTTPSAIDEARRYMADARALDPEVAGRQAERHEAQNRDWAEYVAAAAPGDPWTRTGRDISGRPYSLRLDERTIESQRRILAEQGEREAHLERVRQAAFDRADERHTRALNGSLADFIIPVHGSGDRTGRKTNLYVRPAKEA